MNTCSTCKYWGNSWPIQANKHNECGLIGIDESNSKDTAFIDVQVADDTSLNVEFKTLGNFGCSPHSPKQ